DAAAQHGLLLLLEVPQVDLVVPAAVGQRPAVAPEGHLHLRFPAARWAERLHADERAEIGDVDLPIVEAGRGEEAVIRRERHRADAPVVPPQRRLLLPGGDVPQADAAVILPGRQDLAVGAESYFRDGCLRLSRQGLHRLAGRCGPYAYGPLLTGGGG